MRGWLHITLLRVVGIGLAGLLLYWALARAPVSDIVHAVQQIRPGQLAVLVGVNVLFHGLTALRWWIIARADIPGVRLLHLLGVRLAAFGVSYFTPGPQIGGEPLQVLYLRRTHDTTFARAAATVIVDRLLELMANFFFLVVGFALLLQHGVLGEARSLPWPALLAIVVLLSWPVVHVALLRRGRHPFSALIDRLHFSGRALRIGRFARASEHLAGRFCRRRPRELTWSLLLSLAGCVIAVMEYGLVTSFLKIVLDAWGVLAAWTAGWVSFLLPIPGGLGALEASQVAALGAFGASAAAAFGVTLVLRARDLIFGGVGLILAATLFGKRAGR